MSVDKDTVRRVAKLARLAVPESRLEPMTAELNGIFQWVEMLGEVNVEGVPPMTSVVAQRLKWREDKIIGWRPGRRPDGERAGRRGAFLRGAEGG